MTIGTADLIATNATLGSLAVAGTNLWVSFSITNIAPTSYSGVWYDGLTLSTTPTLTGAITNWEWVGYHSLISGGGYVVTESIPLPGIAAGNYYLIAQADDRDGVPEANKTNNLQALQVTITNRPPFITLLTPTNAVQQTSCVPVSFTLSAAVQLGSYAITNVTFFDGNPTNAIANLATALLSRPQPAAGAWHARHFSLGRGSIWLEKHFRFKRITVHPMARPDKRLAGGYIQQYLRDLYGRIERHQLCH